MKKCIAIFCLLLWSSWSECQTVSDPGFEMSPLAPKAFSYTPYPWAYATGAGITTNGSGFTLSNSPIPEGNQALFLQQKGAITQTVGSWPAGSYQLTFQACQRAWGNSQHDFKVTLDGATVATFKPSDTTWRLYSTPIFPVSAGSHVLGLQGLNTVGGDNTSFVDALSLVRFTVGVDRLYVATSGKVVVVWLKSPDTGKPALPGAVSTIPSLTINGASAGQLSPAWSAPGYSFLFYATPAGVQVKPSDTVTLSAPAGWMTGASGFNLPLTNLVGKAIVDLSSKTLRVGVNHCQLPGMCYWPFRNWKMTGASPPWYNGKFQSNMSFNLNAGGGANGQDGTGNPVPPGLWLVMWDRPPGSNSTFRFNVGNSQWTDTSYTTVTERADLASFPLTGNACARVFDVEPIAGGTRVDLNIWCDVTVDKGYSNLWICAPGEWDIVGGAASLDRSDPYALSRQYLKKVPPNAGSFRWVDSGPCGGNPLSLPQPEWLNSVLAESWVGVQQDCGRIGFTALGPLDPLATPYLYSPWFGKPNCKGETFTATLGADITTAPAAGTHETITVNDAVSAPVFAGLELAIDSEVMRVWQVNGTAVNVYRGSNGTTPATHTAGPLTVNGRQSINAIFTAQGTAGYGNQFTYQLTTQQPHGLVTGLSGFEPQGLPSITWADGSTGGTLVRTVYVNGPNSLVSRWGPGAAVATGTKPAGVTPLDPTKAFWQRIYPRWGGIPYAAQAIATGKFPSTNIVVNIPTDASDDLVATIAQQIRDNFPAGRTVYVEYCNEPWNWFFSPFPTLTVAGDIFLKSKPFLLALYAYRSVQCRDIFKQVFGSRSGEICGYLNCQMGDNGKTYLDYAKANGWTIDALACAPYVAPNDTDDVRAAYTALDDDQCLDVYVHDLLYRSGGTGSQLAALKAQIDAYNRATGGKCRLVCYEGGVGRAVPTNPGGNGWNDARSRNLIYNPLFYWAEQSHYALLQNVGVQDFHIYALGIKWAPDGWGLYHAYLQQPGRGDGSDGQADNRLSRYGVKAATVNQDASCVSVRGQAWLDWNLGVK